MKRAIAWIIVLIMAAAFVGCAPAPQSGETSIPVSFESSASSKGFDPADFTLAICMGSISHPAHRIVQLGFIESAEKLGYEDILISGLDEGGLEELTEKWDSDITKYNAAGVMVWTGDDSLFELLKDWHNRGVKTVVPYFKYSFEDTDTTDSLLSMGTHEFIDANPCFDTYAIGAVAVDFIVASLLEMGLTKGALGISTNGSGLSVIPAIDGFHDRLAELGVGFSVLEFTWEGGELNEAAKRITDYITKYPDMVGAFGNTGGSALAWSSGKSDTDRQDIIAVALDYTPQNLKALEDGGVSGLIARPLYESAFESAKMLDALLRGKVFSKDEWQPIISSRIITADGAGVNGPDYYYDMYERNEAFDWQRYTAR